MERDPYLDSNIGEVVIRITRESYEALQSVGYQPIGTEGLASSYVYQQLKDNYDYYGAYLRDESKRQYLDFFTQMLWRSSQAVGFGFAARINGPYCEYYTVGRYYSRGNFKFGNDLDEYMYRENVRPPFP